MLITRNRTGLPFQKHKKRYDIRPLSPNSWTSGASFLESFGQKPSNSVLEKVDGNSNYSHQWETWEDTPKSAHELGIVIFGILWKIELEICGCNMGNPLLELHLCWIDIFFPSSPLLDNNTKTHRWTVWKIVEWCQAMPEIGDMVCWSTWGIDSKKVSGLGRRTWEGTCFSGCTWRFSEFSDLLSWTTSIFRWRFHMFSYDFIKIPWDDHYKETTGSTAGWLGHGTISWNISLLRASSDLRPSDHCRTTRSEAREIGVWEGFGGNPASFLGVFDFFLPIQG